MPDSHLWLDEALHEKPSLKQELALAKLHLEALRQDLVENWQQLHLRPRPVGEGQRQLACVERCPGEVYFGKLLQLLPSHDFISELPFVIKLNLVPGVG